MRSAIYLGFLVLSEQVQHIAESHGYKPKESKKTDEFLAFLFWVFVMFDIAEFALKYWVR